jgi:hypothetical protein
MKYANDEERKEAQRIRSQAYYHKHKDFYSALSKERYNNDYEYKERRKKYQTDTEYREKRLDYFKKQRETIKDMLAQHQSVSLQV